MHRDPAGRRYQLTSLINPNSDRPNLTYEFLGVTRVWRWTRERMQAAYDAGEVIQPAPGRVPRLKRYLDEQQGKALGDVWMDIPPLNSRAAERLGYPTQKPEALLRRIIAASSDPGDVVLDPFCGCGTTVSVAEQMRRRWIGIDISPTAVNIMANRVRRASPKVIGLPMTVDDLKRLKPFEFQNWVIQKFWGTHSPRKSGDMGIDGYSFMVNDPIQVKQSESVGRNVVDNFETAVERSGKDQGYIVGFSFTRGAREEAARARWDRKIEIRLVTAEQLLEPHHERLLGMFQQTLAEVIDLPLPPSRQPEAKPTVEELVRSDRGAV